MAVDIKKRASERAQALIKLAGVIDPMLGTHNPSFPPHAQFITSSRCQQMLNTKDLTLILQACYQADLYCHITANRNQYPPAYLCPKGAVFMTSKEISHYRNSTAGRVMKLDVLQAAIGMQEGSYQVSTAEEIREHLKERQEHMAELRLREEELHPEKARPQVIIQAPDYSKMGMGVPEGMVMVKKEDLRTMINEGVDARLKALTAQAGSGAGAETTAEMGTGAGVGAGVGGAADSAEFNEFGGSQIPASDQYTVSVGEAANLSPEEARKRTQEALQKAKRLREEENKAGVGKR